jgi:hypothetical protein
VSKQGGQGGGGSLVRADAFALPRGRAQVRADAACPRGCEVGRARGVRGKKLVHADTLGP